MPSGQTTPVEHSSPRLTNDTGAKVTALHPGDKLTSSQRRRGVEARLASNAREAGRRPPTRERRR